VETKKIFKIDPALEEEEEEGEEGGVVSQKLRTVEFFSADSHGGSTVDNLVCH